MHQDELDQFAEEIVIMRNIGGSLFEEKSNSPLSNIPQENFQKK